MGAATKQSPGLPQDEEREQPPEAKKSPENKHSLDQRRRPASGYGVRQPNRVIQRLPQEDPDPVWPRWSLRIALRAAAEFQQPEVGVAVRRRLYASLSALDRPLDLQSWVMARRLRGTEHLAEPVSLAGSAVALAPSATRRKASTGSASPATPRRRHPSPQGRVECPGVDGPGRFPIPNV
jgi:hypothetical protein